MKRFILNTLTVLLVLSAAGTAWASGAEEDVELVPGLYAEITTNRGTMLFLLDYERTPLTVANFCGLAAGILPNDAVGPGVPFYDGMEFYREAPGYAVFAGDPTGKGDGGPGYTLPRETGFVLSAGASGTLVMDGLLSEASGSRFFITQEGDAFLDRKYTPFGRIATGAKTVKKLRKGDVIQTIQIIPLGPEAEALYLDEALFAKLLKDAKQAEIEALGQDNPALADAIMNLGDDRIKTSTGIYYVATAAGEGDKPRAGSRVSMHYTGTLLDGTVFDSSRPRGQTFDFTLGVDGVIPGWIEMVMDMRPGEVRTVVIPPSLAYGQQGYGPIQPNSWLVFEMELVSFTEG